MSVYVDNMMVRYGRMLMSHMVADTVDELHAMADRIGLDRKWFQDRRVPHYDVSKAYRERAISLGAIPVPFGGEPYRCRDCSHLTLACVKRLRCECKRRGD